MCAFLLLDLMTLLLEICLHYSALEIIKLSKMNFAHGVFRSIIYFIFHCMEGTLRPDVSIKM